MTNPPDVGGTLLASVPTFIQPISDPPAPAPAPAPATSEATPRQVTPHRWPRLRQAGDRPAPSDPSRTDATRTGTSDTGSDPATVAELVAGILGLLAGGVAFVLTLTRKRQLREPTEKELDAMARPASRILARHVDGVYLIPDLKDGIHTLGAVGRYLTRAPLVTRRYDDPGVPADLQEAPE